MNTLPPLPTIGEMTQRKLFESVVPAVAVKPQGAPEELPFHERHSWKEEPPLPPLPTIPGRLSEWFPMRQAPWQKGEYEVRHDPKRGCTTEGLTREYWDGFNWPGLRGKFTANAWRGLAQPE